MNAKFVIFIFVTLLSAASSQSCTTRNGISGTCGSISKCPKLLNIMNLIRSKQPPPGGLQTLKESICRFVNGRIPYVCCASSTQSFEGFNPKPLPSRPVTIPQHKGLSLLPDPKSCGTPPFTNFITDGQDARLGDWPWIVIFSGRRRSGHTQFFCGGVLINDRYVLTAAHCFKSDSPITAELARVGDLDLNTPQDCSEGICMPPHQDIGIEQVMKHPQYDLECAECNDIALVRLRSPVKLGTFVRPICLPINPEKDLGFSVRQFQGKFAKAAGWGSTEADPNRGNAPKHLQEVLLPIGESSFCQRIKSNYRSPNTILCAGAGDGKDTCRGDSGGPLQLTSTSRGSQRYVVGITSLGPVVCGSKDTQGIYTNVHSYIDWILDTLQP